MTPPPERPSPLISRVQFLVNLGTGHDGTEVGFADKSGSDITFTLQAEFQFSGEKRSAIGYFYRLEIVIRESECQAAGHFDEGIDRLFEKRLHRDNHVDW